MSDQPDLFSQMSPTGEELRDAGMQKAEDHANQKQPTWSDKAYIFLLGFARRNDTFMVEEVRQAARGIVPEPPSLRAWGSVVTKAAKAGAIKRIGYKEVENPKAHCTPASVWMKI